ncbi:MAG: hypothetical protein AAFR61_11380 [Bacteroidota bacterium]
MAVSVSLDDQCRISNLLADQEINHQYGIDEWVLTVPMSLHPLKEASEIKYYERHALDTLVQLFLADSVPYSLVFKLENPRNYSADILNLELYLTEVSGLLLRTTAYPAIRIGFMGEWLNDSLVRDKVAILIRKWKEEFPAFSGQIVFAGFPYEIRELKDWDTPDVIGIRYHDPSELDFGYYFRQLNGELSTILKGKNKPGWIVESNLVGNHKLELFDHQLRFWDPEVQIQGTVLNTQHCRTALGGQDGPFALSTDKDFLQYLEAYLHFTL